MLIKNTLLIKKRFLLKHASIDLWTLSIEEQGTEWNEFINSTRIIDMLM